ncbi:hypothetical protein Rctr71_096 [Virus Rctr71]|nr:hypothetical protein Rctr71_096 [Virus Rctr71]
MRRLIFPILMAFIMLAVIAVGGVSMQPSPVLAAVTPVSNVDRGPAQLVQFFNGSITADTRVCHDLMNYNVIDLHIMIDQGTTNTVTLKSQIANWEGDYVDETTLVNANTADATSFTQAPLYGRYNCVYADVTNTNPLGLKVFGVAK